MGKKRTIEEKLASKIFGGLNHPSKGMVDALRLYLDHCEQLLQQGKVFLNPMDTNPLTPIYINEEKGTLSFHDDHPVEDFKTIWSSDDHTKYTPRISKDVYDALRESGLERPLIQIFQFEHIVDYIDILRQYEPERCKNRDAGEMATEVLEDFLGNFSEEQLKELLQTTYQKAKYELCGDEWNSVLAFKLYGAIGDKLTDYRSTKKRVVNWRPLKP